MPEEAAQAGDIAVVDAKRPRFPHACRATTSRGRRPATRVPPPLASGRRVFWIFRHQTDARRTSTIVIQSSQATSARTTAITNASVRISSHTRGPRATTSSTTTRVSTNVRTNMNGLCRTRGACTVAHRRRQSKDNHSRCKIFSRYLRRGRFTRSRHLRAGRVPFSRTSWPWGTSPQRCGGGHGQRFLVNTVVGNSDDVPLAVTLNWMTELKKGCLPPLS